MCSIAAVCWRFSRGRRARPGGCRRGPCGSARVPLRWNQIGAECRRSSRAADSTAFGTWPWYSAAKSAKANSVAADFPEEFDVQVFGLGLGARAGRTAPAAELHQHMGALELHPLAVGVLDLQRGVVIGEMVPALKALSSSYSTNIGIRLKKASAGLLDSGRRPIAGANEGRYRAGAFGAAPARHRFWERRLVRRRRFGVQLRWAAAWPVGPRVARGFPRWRTPRGGDANSSLRSSDMRRLVSPRRPPPRRS